MQTTKKESNSVDTHILIKYDFIAMNEDKIIRKIIEIDEKLDKLSTQDSVNDFKNDVMTTLDAHTKILEHLDQERLFTIERVKRIEDDTHQMKVHLKLI